MGVLSWACLNWLPFAGAAKAIQLLREGESQPAAAGQARNEHAECHAGHFKPGKSAGHR